MTFSDNVQLFALRLARALVPKWDAKAPGTERGDHSTWSRGEREEEKGEGGRGGGKEEEEGGRRKIKGEGGLVHRKRHHRERN